MIRHFVSFICAFSTILFSSCTIIEVNGLSNDYVDLTESQKALVHPLESFEMAKPGLVYKLTMPMLKQELERQPKAIVRVFNPACRGNACKPLSTFQQYAQANGYAFYQVMTSYAGLGNAVAQSNEFPMFVIDNEYYKTSLQPLYLRYFTNELVGLPRETKERDVPEELVGQFYFFENGCLTEVKDEL
jgi:hypothetical protein